MKSREQRTFDRAGAITDEEAEPYYQRGDHLDLTEAVESLRWELFYVRQAIAALEHLQPSKAVMKRGTKRARKV
jgi:hypothetical protein